MAALSSHGAGEDGLGEAAGPRGQGEPGLPEGAGREGVPRAGVPGLGREGEDEGGLHPNLSPSHQAPGPSRKRGDPTPEHPPALLAGLGELGGPRSGNGLKGG